MISKEQMERALKEFTSGAAVAFAKARDAERSLEAYTYSPRRDYTPERREKLLEAFRDADYEAESRAWIRELIKKALKPERHSIPHNAVCFWLEGDKMQAVFGDFVDLQNSPAGFGDNFDEALADLKVQSSSNVRPYLENDTLKPDATGTIERCR
jgi:hypothetical protein